MAVPQGAIDAMIPPEDEMPPAAQLVTFDATFRAYVNALLQDGNNGAVFEALSHLDVPAPYYLRMKVFFSREVPALGLERLVDSGDLTSLSAEASVFAYRAVIGRKYKVEVDTPFAVFSFTELDLPENVQVVVSVCKRHEWDALRRRLQKEYPRLVPVLLSQRELVSGVQSLRTLTGHAVQVKSYSARERIGSPRTRQWKVKREWTDEELDEVLSTVQDRSEVITSLDVEFFPKKGQASHVVPTAVCRIRKTGEIEVDGSFRIAFEAVASVVAQAGHKKLLFFSDRGLRHSDYKPRPLAITYANPVFEDTQAVRTLVELMIRYPHSMRAVQHGNPYAHLKLTDTLDFSSFDIWAVPPSRLAILPGLRASEAAFERLIDYVFENFKEGDVVEYQHAG